MNNILIYTNANYKPSIHDLKTAIEILHQFDKHVFIHNTLIAEVLSLKGNIKLEKLFSYTKLEDIKRPLNLMLSLGGDGTFLEGLHFIKNNNIPILGINTGRLGFLANLNLNELENALEFIFRGEYCIEQRTMLKLESELNFNNFNYALNEFTIHKLNTSSMITIDLIINGDHVNTYWADGIIISTPTGSTAYSLSAGGPILHPDSKNFVITPIAVHNLNVRPLIVPDNSIISFKVSGRSENCMISLDHKSLPAPINSTFIISKADIYASLLHCNTYNFFNTLKTKLMWGVDKRN